MKKFILLLLTPLVINAMEVDTSSPLETPTTLVQRLQNAQSNRDTTLPNELFGMVSKELADVKPAKIAASLKELYTGSKSDRDLFNSVASYLVEQLIQRKQEKSILDQWFNEKDEKEKNIKELLTNEFNRQNQFQLVHLFTEKQYRHLQPLISSDCLSDEIKKIICSHLDSNDNPQYVKNLDGHTNGVLSIAITSDNHIATGSNDKKAKIWNLDGNCIMTLAGHTKAISSVAVTHDNHIVTGSWDRTAKIWNHDGSCIATLSGHTGSISSVAVTHDNHIVTGSYDSTAKIWNHDGSCIATLTGHTNWVTSVGITSDNHIVTGSCDNTAKIWNLDGSCIASLTDTNPITSVAVIHDNHIVTASWDNTAKIWNLDGSCIATLTGHTSSIQSVAITHDNHIVTGSWDHTAKIWDLKQWQQDITTQEINNLNLKQLMLINYLDLSIKQGITFAPKSTREAADSLPPLIRKNIEKRIALPTKASTAPCTIL